MTDPFTHPQFQPLPHFQPQEQQLKIVYQEPPPHVTIALRLLAEVNRDGSSKIREAFCFAEKILADYLKQFAEAG